MKIAVYTIALNEAQFIERWAKSCEEAEYKFIIDTGSTDNTVELAQQYGCQVVQISVKPWRFDVARNAALALLPADADYCISLDADEVLMPGWRQAFDKLDRNVTRPRYKYVWSSNPDGSERLTFGGDKIHARHGYRWVHPVHETLFPIGEEIQGWVDVDMRHYPDPTKSRSQYLGLLELAIKESPNDDRTLFYLGREYMFNNRGNEAIPYLLKHLELSKWPPERATCMRYLGKITGNKEHWFLRACAESPERREPWNDLAFYYYELGNWESSYSAAKKALSIKEKPLEYLCEPEAWGAMPHDLAGIAAWSMGLKTSAIQHTTDAFVFDPADERVRSNLSLMYRDSRINDVCAIIPSKSNIDGLKKVVSLLLNESSVKQIVIVADGPAAFELIQKNIEQDIKVTIISSELGAGIHVMWNKGLNFGKNFNHCLFINDDVEFEPHAIDTLAAVLDSNKELGIVCPNYDNRMIKSLYQSVEIACPGFYDGTDGLAGFCMMLSKDLTNLWKFDDRMKWYYGDNDVLNWVRSIGRVGAICSISKMNLNPSWTMKNDPPENYDEIIKSDKMIFEEKWNIDNEH